MVPLFALPPHFALFSFVVFFYLFLFKFLKLRCHVLNNVGKVKVPLLIEHNSPKTLDATVHVSVGGNT